MACAQKDMVLGPFAMVMRLGMIVNMPGVMIVRVVVMNRHGASVTPRQDNFSLITAAHIGPVGSVPGARQTKFLASLLSPVPL